MALSQEISLPSPHRETIVRALTSYYTLLTQFPYLPDTAIEHAPQRGWGLYMAANLRLIGKKSATVVDVLKHIPYLTNARNFEISYDTATIDWRADEVRRVIISGQGPQTMGGLGPAAIDIPRSQQASLEPMMLALPESVISLTRAPNYGRWLLLDVDTDPDPKPPPTDQEIEIGVQWRRHKLMSIVEFFDD